MAGIRLAFSKNYLETEMTELFSHNDSSKHSAPKAPTTYEFFKQPTSAQKKALYPVELIFAPSGVINSWGFVADKCRFNIYPTDSRYPELAAAIQDVFTNQQELYIKYSQNDRGFATLVLGKSKSIVWDKRGNSMYKATR